MAKVYFSPEHNAAAIDMIDHDDHLDKVTNAINYALEKLYSAPGDLGPYIYEAWNGDSLLGLVISEPFGVTEDSRILLEFDRILNSNKEAPELGDWASKEVK